MQVSQGSYHITSIVEHREEAEHEYRLDILQGIILVHLEASISDPNPSI